MILQDKKVQEFTSIMSNDKVKLVFIAGPPGCGKNSLINLYCKKNGVPVSAYKEETDSKSFDESLGLNKEYINPLNAYP